MEKNKYYDLIVELIKENQKFPGHEDILDAIAEDVYNHAKVVLNSVTNEDVISAYLEKVISTSIITVSKKLNKNTRMRSSNAVDAIIAARKAAAATKLSSVKAETVEKVDLTVNTELVDKMINGIAVQQESTEPLQEAEEETPIFEPIIDSLDIPEETPVLEDSVPAESDEYLNQISSADFEEPVLQEEEDEVLLDINSDESLNMDIDNIAEIESPTEEEEGGGEEEEEEEEEIPSVDFNQEFTIEDSSADITELIPPNNDVTEAEESLIDTSQEDLKSDESIDEYKDSENLTETFIKESEPPQDIPEETNSSEEIGEEDSSNNLLEDVSQGVDELFAETGNDVDTLPEISEEINMGFDVISETESLPLEENSSIQDLEEINPAGADIIDEDANSAQDTRAENIAIPDYSLFSYNPEPQESLWNEADVEEALATIDKKEPDSNIFELYKLRYNKGYTVDKICKELNLDKESVIDSLIEISLLVKE